MTTEANKALIRQQFELLGAGDLRGAAGLWSAAALNHGRPIDPAGIEKVYASLRAVQESHTLHEMVAEGEWVSVRTTCHGVHAAEPAFAVNSGIFTGLPPSGRSYTVQHLHLFRVVDGRILEHWACRDDLGAARQIGLELRPQSRESESRS
ncbi:MAG: ester cyclase [Thermoplasmata archaeon]|nr:ester cyclase [Thermoplasmata archaeon]MCI4344203.1 ester cyclase [Thermoplasmata archaeon]